MGPTSKDVYAELPKFGDPDRNFLDYFFDGKVRALCPPLWFLGLMQWILGVRYGLLCVYLP